jgi:alkylhydroperoxidase family enzyme
MEYMKVNQLPIVDETDAEGDVAKVFEEYKRVMEIPYVPNMLKGLAPSPAALSIHWELIKSLMNHTTFPETVLYIILYSIAKSRDNDYTSGNNELSCRTLGIEESTISTLVENIDNVGPERVREIVKFALEVSKDPNGLTAEAFERVRESGVTDDELIEMIQIAAISNYLETIARALEISMDSGI